MYFEGRVSACLDEKWGSIYHGFVVVEHMEEMVRVFWSRGLIGEKYKEDT